MEILHITNKGRSVDNIEECYIYKEIKNCNQIIDKNTVKPNKIFDIVIHGEADRAHTRTQPHNSNKNQSLGFQYHMRTEQHTPGYANASNIPYTVAEHHITTDSLPCSHIPSDITGHTHNHCRTIRT